MRFAFACLMCFALAFANKDLNQINKDIKNQERRQQDIDKQKNNLNLKLSALGQNITDNVEQLKKLDSEIKNLVKNIESNKDQNKNHEEKLKSLQDKLLNLHAQREKNKEELSTLILRYMTFSHVLDDEEVIGMDDVMARESFRLLKRQTIQNINDIEKQQTRISKEIDNITKNINEVTKMISAQEARAQNLQSMIDKQKVLVDNMRSEVKVYNQRLRNIENQRKEIDKLLSALNISKKNKQEEIRKQKEQERLAKQEAERLAKLEKERQKKLEEDKKQARLAKEAAEKKAKQEAEKIAKTDSKKAQEFLGKQNKAIQQEYEAKITASEAKSAISDFENLKRVDSVYQKPETARYTGKRMLSPLDSYTIDQAFGDYVDPAYKIKIFNNGVVLKSRKQDAQVYSIMDGKVIYAQEMSGLKKVVVIEHANSMHTIYSMLDKIAPTLKPGFVVKQGYVIGRVSDKLNLEIVQAGKHINPVEVIAKK